MKMSTGTIKPVGIISGSGGRLYSSTTTQAFKSIGVPNEYKNFVSSAQESFIPLAARQMQKQMTNTPS